MKMVKAVFMVMIAVLVLGACDLSKEQDQKKIHIVNCDYFGDYNLYEVNLELWIDENNKEAWAPIAGSSDRVKVTRGTALIVVPLVTYLQKPWNGSGWFDVKFKLEYGTRPYPSREGIWKNVRINKDITVLDFNDMEVINGW